MKRKSFRIYIAIAVLLVFGYAIFQVAILLSKPVTTEKLRAYTADDFFEVDGFVMRKEMLVNSLNSGTADYVVNEGERVKKDSTVAVMYSGAGDISIKKKISDLEKKIAQIENSQSAKDLYISDAIKLESMIEEKLLEINSASKSKATANMGKLTEELSLLLTKKQIVLGEVSGYDEKLQSLKTQCENLKKTVSGKYANIIAPIAGYFSSNYDGFENLLEPEYLKKNGILAFNEILALKEGSKKPANNIGKIIEDFEWYYAAVVSSDKLNDFSVGDTIRIAFPNSQVGSIDAEIWHMENGNDGKLVILKSNNSTSEILDLRREKAQIITNSFKGFRVNKAAVRMVNNKTGIFVLIGVQIQFKPVKVLFSKDEYMIILPDVSQKVSLLPNEEVVVAGKELFDGKIVK